MATVKISSDFFTNEIKNYSNWEFAFWRELFQNSVDAKANNISINYEKNNDSCIISFQDNGCGMSRDILENVFFNLGTTTKNTNETVGGFGRARIILCFAQQDYIIYTQNMIVSGQGANYEILENDGFVKGCKFIITVKPKDFSSNYTSFINSLYQYLDMSQIEPYIFINGKKHNTKLYKRGKTKELSFGTAYSNQSGLFKNKIIFRVNGIPMFERYTPANSLIIVEIDPEKSRDVLLSNRDSINWKYLDEVEQFTSVIAIDTISAFRNKTEESKQIIGYSRKFIPKKNIIEKQKLDYIIDVQRPLDVDYCVKNWNPGICLITKTENNKIKRASKLFDIETISDKTTKKGKLFNLWQLCCESALESFCKVTGTNEINWMPGFIFDESMEACNQNNNNCFALLLNPLYCLGDKTGNIRYNINDFQSQIHMLTLAAHEVCHCKYNYHDERFASLFTDIVSDLMSNIKNIMKEIKLSHCKM